MRQLAHSRPKNRAPLGAVSVVATLVLGCHGGPGSDECRVFVNEELVAAPTTLSFQGQAHAIASNSTLLSLVVNVPYTGCPASCASGPAGCAWYQDTVHSLVIRNDTRSAFAVDQGAQAALGADVSAGNGYELRIWVDYTPPAPGEDQAQMVIESNATNGPELDVSLSGIACQTALADGGCPNADGGRFLDAGNFDGG